MVGIIMMTDIYWPKWRPPQIKKSGKRDNFMARIYDEDQDSVWPGEGRGNQAAVLVISISNHTPPMNDHAII